MTNLYPSAPLDDEPDGSTLEGLIFLIERQRDLIAAIATGTSITPAGNDAYREMRKRIRPALARLDIADPFPWPDLNQWWAYCSAPRFTKYAERRVYVNDISEPVLDELEQRKSRVTDWVPPASAETWATIEVRLAGLKDRLDNARNLDDWQDIGRRSREVLIAATNVVFKDEMMQEGVMAPKAADAKARFDAVVDTLARGASHAELRQLMRAAWDLAQKVTHSSGISRVDAFAAAQSTVVIVRTLQEIERALAQ